MNWLDIAIALIVTLPAFFGFRKGFVRKLLGIVGIIAGFVFAVKFYELGAGILSAVIKENTAFRNVVSFLIIIGLFYGTSIWIARFISNTDSGTGIIDKLLGAVFGFLQGIFVASVLLYNLSFADLPSQKTRETSLLYPSVIKVAPAVFDKVMEVFPGLQDLYYNYKNPPKQTEPQKKNSPGINE
jgi:membrane protein required for colicin V production